MNIFKNIVTIVKVYDAIKYLTKYKIGISKARGAGDLESEREQILKLTVTWGKHLVNMFDIDLNVTGRENLPDKGPVVFVPNHESFLDIPIACAVFDKFQFAFVAKDAFKRLPIYGKLIRQIRSVFIDGDVARASLKTIDEGIHLIENGFSLLIFPEGKRNKGGPVGEFKKGSLRLATKPGVPVIPVTINGAHRIFERQGYVKKGERVDVIIHPMIETMGMEKSAANNLAAEVEKIVKNGLETSVLIYSSQTARRT